MSGDVENNLKVEIIYCVEWGFLPLASGLAASIQDKFGIVADLIEGHNGIYEVAVNGNVIYSNKGICSQRPKEEQIFEEIQKHAAPQRRKQENEIIKAVDSCCVPTSNDTGCSWS